MIDVVRTPEERFRGLPDFPYDPRYAGKVLYNASDDPAYDTWVPRHPLSKIRRNFRTIRESLCLTEG